MEHYFIDRTAKIMAEVRARTCIDDDAEVIKEIFTR